MKVSVIGAGAMGGSFGGLLAEAGHEVLLVDAWQAHVDAINAHGLRIETPDGERVVKVPAVNGDGAKAYARDNNGFDVAIVFVDSNATADVAALAGDMLKPGGCAATFQNGIGNVEALVDTLGQARVVGGSSMCSAASRGAGHVALTHRGPTTLGELDGRTTPRVEALREALREAGFDANISDAIEGKIWNKLVLNAGINAICATTGMRMGEMARVPEIDALQSAVLDEVMQVVTAKGISLPDSDVVATIKRECYAKFNKPSMLQHIEAGRRTEIDAINGALVREGKALGIAMPYNEALVALLKGREIRRQREVHQPDLDYDEWERRGD